MEDEHRAVKEKEKEKFICCTVACLNEFKGME